MKPSLLRIALLLLALSVLCAKEIRAERVPHEFFASNGLPIQDVKIEGCPLPAGEIWPHVATIHIPFYEKLLFWKKRPVFDAATFTRDLVRVDHILRREGWHKVTVRGEVNPAKKGRVSVVYHVTVGEYTKVLQYWINAKELSAKDTLKFRRYVSLTKGHRFREIEVQQAADSLQTIYRTHGYARAKVRSSVTWKPDTAGVDSMGVEVNLLVDAGPVCTFGESSVSGQVRLDSNDIKSDLLTTPGKQYSISLIERSRRILYSRSLFRSVDITVNDTVQGNRLPVMVRVAEGNRWQTRFGGGWVTGVEQKWEGIGELTDRFLLGHGRIFRINGNASKLDATGTVTVSFPHAFGAGSEFSVAPYAHRSWEFGFNAIGSKQSISFLSGQWWTIQLSQDLQRSWIFDTTKTSDSITSAKNIAKTSFTNRDLYTLTGIYDFRNDPFEPTEGGIFSPEIGVSGVLLPNTSRFVRLKGFGTYAITFDRKLTYATRIETGALMPYGNYIAPSPEDLFYLGSPGLLRGWRRHALSPRNSANLPIGGEAVLAGGFEIRGKIWGPLWLAGFFDAGNVWDKYKQFGTWPLMTSVGTGVRLRSPVGVIRFDVGWQTRKNNLNEPRAPNFIVAIGEAL